MSTLGLLRMTEPAVFGYNMSYVHKWSSNCCTTFACLHCKHNTTQHNPTQHNTKQHNTTQHNTTQHNTTQYNTTQHNTKQHNTTQHNTTQHNTTQHNTTQHNTTQHNTTQHNTTQHNTTQHNTTQHKICGFVCCHRGDRGGGVTFQVRVGPVLTQHRRGWGGTFYLCVGRPC